MMEGQHQRQLLLIVLWVLIALILLLLAVNAFFIYHLYLAPQPDDLKEDLVNQTLTAVGFEPGLEEATSTPELPTASPRPTETPMVPTETPAPEGNEVLYIVKLSDTVQSLAESFGVKLEDLRARNQMLGDFLLVDQKLYIPAQGEAYEPALVFSTMDVDDRYQLMPQSASDSATTIQVYMEEDRLAFQARDQLSQLIKDAFLFTANQLEGETPGVLDAYVASGPFSPETPVRVHYVPAQEPRLFVLHDGSGSLVDVNFHLVYGMAQLWGAEVWGGTPEDVLREGMAYALADSRSAGSGNLQLCDVALAYQIEDKLPDLTSVGNWDIEWTRNMINLSTAGCYYQYLLETYPAEDVQVLYTSGEYAPLLGASFEAEVALFEDWLAEKTPSQEMDPSGFVEQMDRLVALNRLFFADMDSWEYKIELYYNLDQARLRLWQNDVRHALVRMTTAEAMLGLTTNTVELTPTPEGTLAPSSLRTPDEDETPFATWTPWPTIDFGPTRTPWWEPDPTEED
ncbi:MAG: LysM peptidoglycan-binding domain-containing protein [Anaerolineae bacterium]|jgi:LysM repeat protein|nr:LysM peptidoglycan-binding domain-containing protein [Anaerolineae bacterium]